MDKNDITDHQLMAALAKGDLTALDAVIRRYQQRVFALAYRMLRNWHSAEDITQETFIRLYNSAPQYKPEAKLITFLYPVVLNLCRDMQRKNARLTHSEIPAELLASYDEPQSAAILNENATIISNAVSELPERQKIALLLHRFDGLSHAEIAKIMEISPSAAESLLVRAYAALRLSLIKLKDI